MALLNSIPACALLDCRFVRVTSSTTRCMALCGSCGSVEWLAMQYLSAHDDRQHNYAHYSTPIAACRGFGYLITSQTTVTVEPESVKVPRT